MEGLVKDGATPASFLYLHCRVRAQADEHDGLDTARLEWEQAVVFEKHNAFVCGGEHSGLRQGSVDVAPSELAVWPCFRWVKVPW